MGLKYFVVIALSFQILFVFGQSPHGEDFNVSCDLCHSPNGWELIEKSNFNHDTTNFMLQGAHKDTECRLCHTRLVFTDADMECRTCHTDMHKNTVGQQCDYCHNTSSWIVQDVVSMHRMSRFPLTGAHLITDCYACHNSASELNFEVMGIDCYACHQQNYVSTSNPSHAEAGYSTDCEECHSLHATQWDASGFEHGYFPLIDGHSEIDCNTCHTEMPYANIPSDCYECHAAEYEATSEPNHQSMGFPTDCKSCHSLSYDWSPVNYKEHDSEYFPISSGTHKGEWNTCADCHTQSNDYTIFTCLDCHEHNQSSMDRKHRNRRNYEYVSWACYDCHPRGKED